MFEHLIKPFETSEDVLKLFQSVKTVVKVSKTIAIGLKMPSEHFL